MDHIAGILHVDRRQHPRADVELQVMLSVAGKVVEAKAIDVSVGGMRLETDVVVAAGTMLVLHFGLPGQNVTYRVDGEVMWDRESGSDRRLCGVRFVNASRVTVAGIKLLLKELGPQAIAGSPAGPGEPTGDPLSPTSTTGEPGPGEPNLEAQVEQGGLPSFGVPRDGFEALTIPQGELDAAIEQVEAPRDEAQASPGDVRQDGLQDEFEPVAISQDEFEAVGEEEFSLAEPQDSQDEGVFATPQDGPPQDGPEAWAAQLQATIRSDHSLREDQLKEAEELHQKAVEAFSANDADTASKLLERAMELVPDSIEVVRELARVSYALGDVVRAAELFDRAMRLELESK
ncbi:PilZ domain-containing protein [Myxococcota bacterium]